MESPDDFVGPVNLGNPAEFTMKELADRVIELTGSRSKPTFKPLPHDDPVQRCPDIALAQQRLEWNPTTTLDEGLKETIAYFDRLLSRVGKAAR
jgi:UDP-glucuronate decarboxylase